MSRPVTQLATLMHRANIRGFIFDICDVVENAGYALEAVLERAGKVVEC